MDKAKEITQSNKVYINEINSGAKLLLNFNKDDDDKTKRYEIKKEFQKGGFGNIFLAYVNKEKREVVIKKIDKNKIKEQIFNREIKTMKEIKCDYSVEIYDYYNDNNYYYIVKKNVMEIYLIYWKIRKDFQNQKLKLFYFN